MMTRDERQDEFIDHFAANRGCGTLEATTAFGKTWVGLKAIRYMRRKHPDRTALVVVPRKYLKEQWINFLTIQGEIKGVQVEVINTASKNNYAVDLLILDEIHRYAAESFSEIFGRVKRRFTLGLTATMKRLDHKHTLLTRECPIIDVVPTIEATRNGWISRYLEFNLGIQLPAVEMDKYRQAEESYEEIMNFFMWDFGMMKKCCLSYKPINEGGGRYRDSACADVARRYGWKGLTAEEAYANMLARKHDLWGNASHKFAPKGIYIRAINGMRQMRKIKNIIYGHPIKVAVAVDLCNKIPVKTITFSELTKTADAITVALNKPHAVFIAESYHTGVKRKAHMTREATMKFIIDAFKDGGIRCINSARGLDEGADFPEVELGVRVAGTSAPTQHTQRRGRIVRKFGDKLALMVNLYLLGTKEQGWLAKAQGHETEVYWVESVEEITDLIKASYLL